MAVVLVAWSFGLSTAPRRYSHLVVLLHGLGGTSKDLKYLGDVLAARDCEVLAVKSNEGRTRDGVHLGARRACDEVRAFVEARPHLRCVSFVGNSLGGLFARECVAQLDRGGKVAGLRPECFVTIATPHLGVRRLAWCPGPFLQGGVAPLVVGDTARDLFLSTPTLAEMAGPAHLRSLRRFRRRVLVFNTRSDLMVPPCTSSLDTSQYPVDSPEYRMGQALRRVGWTRVEVTMGVLPIAHNRICALARDPVSALVNAPGRSVMRRVADEICGAEEATGLAQERDGAPASRRWDVAWKWWTPDVVVRVDRILA